MNKSCFSSILLCFTGMLFGNVSFAQINEQSLKGYWAMKPQKNGLANTAYFDGKGHSVLYQMNCNFQKNTVEIAPPLEFAYHIKDQILYVSNTKNPDDIQALTIKMLTDEKLILQQEITLGTTRVMESQHVSSLMNLCPA